ncbi:MAG: sugar ABC transporter substrate-binding protein [Firmicutes bacterium]|nr:sugar ABC transporter substrate-binding protein [Bacillota bacterium]
MIRRFLVYLFIVALAVVMGFVACIETQAQKKVEIRYWTFLQRGGQTPRELGETAIIEGFEKKYPNIKVRVEMVPWPEMDTKLITSVAAGRGPDVTRADSFRIREHLAANTLEDLRKYVSKMSVEERKDFLVWDEGLPGGKKPNFYLHHSCWALYYRKDLFQKGGLEPPNSWDDLVDVSKKLTTDKIWGFVQGMDRGQPGVTYTLWPMILGAGGNILENDKAVFNSAPAIKTLQFIYDLVYKHRVSPVDQLTYSYDNVMEGFMAGKFAMVIEGAHRYGHMQTSAILKDNVGLTYIPSPVSGEPSPTLMSGWTLGIPVTSRHKDEAWKFIEYYVSAEAQLMNAKLAGELPVRRSVLNDPYFQTKEAAAQRFFALYLNTKSQPFPKSQNYGLLKDTFVMALHEILTNRKTVQKALDDAVAKYNEALKK